MGAWGPAIFSDDTACDVHDEWRDYLGIGLSPGQATDKLLSQWEESIDDVDDGPVIWLALAATQWKLGRLEERVKDHALKVIEDGSNLERWREDPKLLKKREGVLEKLREELMSPQPEPKKIRKNIKATCDWEPGEVIAYHLRSGRYVLFLVTGLTTDRGGTHPYCRFYDWVGDEIPRENEIAKLGFRDKMVMIGDGGKPGYPAKRITRTGLRQPIKDPTRRFVVGVWWWAIVDDRLKENWGYE